MPITIDGTGNITGLVAGGLPDGSINNADLATDAVSTSKILNGAVTTAKMGSSEQSGLAKAWVNFNGTGTVAIRASGNVSSITDNGTGDYTVNFTTAMADTNYAFSFGAGSGNGRTMVLYNGTFNTTDSSSAKAVGSIRVAFLELSAGGTADNTQISVAVFR